MTGCNTHDIYESHDKESPYSIGSRAIRDIFLLFSRTVGGRFLHEYLEFSAPYHVGEGDPNAVQFMTVQFVTIDAGTLPCIPLSRDYELPTRMEPIVQMDSHPIKQRCAEPERRIRISQSLDVEKPDRAPCAMDGTQMHPVFS